MKYNDACNILNIQSPFNSNQLKKNYYSLALKHHPDRDLDKNAKKKFQEIVEAYNYLNNYIENNNFSNDKLNTSESYKNTYFDMVNDFLEEIINKRLDKEKFINLINNNCNEITKDVFNNLSKTTILQFKEISKQYSDILNIKTDIINKIDNIVNEYIKHDKIIILNPSLNNLLDNDVHKLFFNNEIFYIPYWHHELIYDLSNISLIIKCEPKIPECTYIDKYNNLYISISTNISEIINIKYININIANRIFNILVSELRIIKYQKYIIKNNGISNIDTNNIYNISKLSDVYIEITFNDID